MALQKNSVLFQGVRSEPFQTTSELFRKQALFLIPEKHAKSHELICIVDVHTLALNYSRISLEDAHLG